MKKKNYIKEIKTGSVGDEISGATDLHQQYQQKHLKIDSTSFWPRFFGITSTLIDPFRFEKNSDTFTKLCKYLYLETVWKEVKCDDENQGAKLPRPIYESVNGPRGAPHILFHFQHFFWPLLHCLFFYLYNPNQPSFTKC